MVFSLLGLVARRAGMSSLSRIAGGAALVGAGSAFVALAGGNQVGSDPFKGTNTTFPDDLENNDHWVSFEAVETEGQAADILGSLGLGNLNIGAFKTGNGGSVFLPMPSNLSTDYNPEYTTPDLGPAAGMALKPFDRAMYGNKDLGNEALSGGAIAGAIGIGAGVAAGAGIGAAQSAIGDATFGAALKVAAGVAANPHKIVLFTGVNFRDHTFSWRLSPKNREESNRIKSIIDFFTFYSHPEYVASGLFFKYPEFFNIRFHHPEYLFTLRPSVCTDIRVNYHTQGYPAYVRNADGSGAPAPAEIELTLTFKETEIVTKNSLNPPMTVTATRNTVIDPTPRDPQTGATGRGEIGTTPNQIGPF